MLTLTRKVNQKIIIADGEIKVTVLGIVGNKIRFGIEAPDYIEIHREEVFERIKLGNHAKNAKNTQFEPIKKSAQLIDKFGHNDLAEADFRNSTDPILLERVRAGQAEAQFGLGKIMYEQHRYNFARNFLTLALGQGVLEAQKYLDAINK